MDSIMLGIAAVLVALVGVGATLIAPRLGRRARIWFQIQQVSSVSRPMPAGDVIVQIMHNGRPIDESAFLFTASIANTGSRDVTIADFVDPIFVTASERIRILSVEANAPAGVVPELKVEQHRVQVRWNILKPGERIELRGVAASLNEEPDVDWLKENVRGILRLRDVSVGQGWTSLARSALLNGGLIVVMTIIQISTLLFRSFWPHDAVIYKDTQGKEKVIAGLSRECDLHPANIVGRCQNITESELRKIAPLAHSRRIVEAIEPFEIVMCVISFSVAALFIIYQIPAIKRRVDRLFRRR